MYLSNVLRKGPGLAIACALVALVAPAASHARPATPPKADAAAEGCANTDLKPTRANLELVRDAVLCLHNRERASHGLPKLKENPKLRRAAERHSSNMVDSRFFDHTSPGGSTMVDRIRRTGYTSRASSWALGENIAWGSGRLATAAADPPQLDALLRPPRRTSSCARSARSGSASRPGCPSGSPPRSRAPRTPQTSASADRAGPATSPGQRRHVVSLRRPVADVQPLNALHYALDRVGGLPPVVAPPYDVIDAELRARLAARSPYNVVEIDLPQGRRRPRPLRPRRRAVRPLAGRGDPRPRPRARAVGARPGLHGPRRQRLHAQGLLRPRARRGLRPGPHPPPRAHPPGPEGGPPAAHPRDAGQPLPHLQPLRRPRRRRLGRAQPPHRVRPVGRGHRRRRHEAPPLARRRRRRRSPPSPTRWPRPSC